MEWRWSYGTVTRVVASVLNLRVVAAVAVVVVAMIIILALGRRERHWPRFSTSWKSPKRNTLTLMPSPFQPFHPISSPCLLPLSPSLLSSSSAKSLGLDCGCLTPPFPNVFAPCCSLAGRSTPSPVAPNSLPPDGLLYDLYCRRLTLNEVKTCAHTQKTR